ncbi:tRNA delta(2)-isopentenylpyrophosphate transferase [Spiroplasma litorale]|uniref:tRNA dimethylallyltransferase n=1 Tax=Spiroplasma litorale TaxID=216942 RepID=A0A0K1W101_9MOLU|nr:tRNA (adenosine(37)-N6)-dimethylallyltransferase MiaA [Spiroplasma litorale]AKX34004.1 tRNA delta(2)-isopentenylpyrophosphate transferase [Spiroplasma litorale]
MKPIVVIVGPTASGKTDLSIKIAKKFNGECINADSTQIFKGTDIATNKISIEEMQGIKHHMISIKEVNENYSVAEFQKEARVIIDNLLKEDIMPIVVGGTGLYINALIMNYNFNNKDHINNYSEQFSNLDNESLWKVLYKIDEKEANKIHPNNRYRVLRALEINELNSRNKSSIIKDNKSYYYKNIIIIGLDPIRNELYDKINDRVLNLIEKGLFEEIIEAYEKCSKNELSQALKCIGGPEIIKYINNQISYPESIELMQKNNRHYARRQLTWFKNQLKDVNWFEYTYDDFENICEKILLFLKNKLLD